MNTGPLRPSHFQSRGKQSPWSLLVPLPTSQMGKLRLTVPALPKPKETVQEVPQEPRGNLEDPLFWEEADLSPFQQLHQLPTGDIH